MKSNIETKTLPNDNECETAVLGALLCERYTINEVRDLLTEESFYQEFHRNVYKAILSIVDRGDRADIITVAAELKKMDIKFEPYNLALISNKRSFNTYQHACYLHDLEKRRRLWFIGQKLVTDSLEETEDIVDVLSNAENLLSDVFKNSVQNISTLNEALKCVYENINNNLSCEHLTGTPTGFSQLDKRSGGLQKSDLIIIAGETSSGKTSLVVSMMRNATLSSAKCAMYSMEMKKEQIAARLLSIESGIPANEILYSSLNSRQVEIIDKSTSKLVDKAIYFDDRSTSNIDTIIASIRSMKLKYGIDGAVIDYLQILNVNMKGTSKEQQMGDVARRLKNLAKELDIFIIALSQLNRDSLNPVPSLNRLRDSGQIAEAADMVILIYRAEVYGKQYPEDFSTVSTENTALIDIAKGRNIGLQKFICGFDKKTTKFFDLNEIPLGQVNEDDNPF